MGVEPSSPGVAAVARALERYAATIVELPPEAPPHAAARVREFASNVRAFTQPPGTAWQWGRALATWHRWQPVRLERHLTGPDPTALSRHLDDCHAALRRASPTDGRRWNLFTRAEPADGSGLLGRSVEFLEAACEPTPGWLLAVIDRAAHAAREVEAKLAVLPSDWVAARLARAATPLADEWPVDPPNVDADFSALLSHVLSVTLSYRGSREGRALFHAVVAEVATDLGSERCPTGLLDSFQVVYTAFQAPSPPEWLTLLARLGWVAVRESMPGLVPQIDPESLTVPTGYRPDTSVTDIRYVPHERPRGTVTSVDRFAVPPARPAVVVSIGPNPVGDWAALSLPSPHELPELPAGRWQDLLRADRSGAEAAFWASEQPNTRAPTSPEWSAWLETPDGATWFQDLAHAATGPRPDAARRLLAFLTSTHGIPCYPSVDDRTGMLRWPADVPVCQPGASFRFGGQPALDILAVGRFATTAAAAEFVVDVGDDPRQAAAGEVWNALRQLPLITTEAARGLEAVLRGGTTLPADGVLVALDSLTRAEQHARDPGMDRSVLEHLDAALRAIRALATVSGLTVLPEQWVFAGGGPWLGDGAGGVTAKPVFRSSELVSHVFRVKVFGLRREQDILREGEVVVSAGPAPVRLPELEAAAETAPGALLRSALAELRAAGLGGYLEPAMVGVFTTFWDRVYHDWAGHDAAAAARFDELLRSSLQETFGLETFAPANYRDHPEGWVQAPPGTRMTTGQVTHLLRPGLLDTTRSLRVPARAEVD